MRRAYQKVATPVIFESLSNGQALIDRLMRNYGEDDGASMQSPDVVILDMNLPVMSGIETLRCIRTDPVSSLVPVVVLSTSDVEYDARRCYEVGANAVFTKAASFAKTIEIASVIAEFWHAHGIRRIGRQVPR